MGQRRQELGRFTWFDARFLFCVVFWVVFRVLDGL